MSSGIANFNTATGLQWNDNHETARVGAFACNACCSGGGGACCIPIGGIIMYDVTPSAFPISIGGATWHLCDGLNGTPDLRNQFVYGASVDADVGTTGGATTSTATITITAADLPTHTHSIPILSGTAAATATAAANTTAPNGPASATAGDIANVAHNHTAFGSSVGGNPTTFRTFYTYNPPMAAADVQLWRTMYGGYIDGGGTYQGPTGTSYAQANDANYTGGVYTGNTPPLKDHYHGIPALTVPASAVSTVASTTGATGNPVPITITSTPFSILPPYTMLYYIKRTA